MKTILISGRRKSGKSTLAQFLIDHQQILFPGKSVYRAPFAAPIKNFCVDIFGLPYELVWGSDEQKETLTHYRWEDMPHYLDICHRIAFEVATRNGMSFDYTFESYLRSVTRGLAKPILRLLSSSAAQEEYFQLLPVGPMTIRQIQQEVGTGMGRKMDPDLWVDSWERMNYFPEDTDRVAIADDLRFGNELDMGHEVGAFCLRLTRGRTGDNHPSETSLADDDPRFHSVLDNKSLSLRQTVGQLLAALCYDGVVPFDAAEACLDALDQAGVAE